MSHVTHSTNRSFQDVHSQLWKRFIKLSTFWVPVIPRVNTVSSSPFGCKAKQDTNQVNLRIVSWIKVYSWQISQNSQNQLTEMTWVRLVTFHDVPNVLDAKHSSVVHRVVRQFLECRAPQHSKWETWRWKIVACTTCQCRRKTFAAVHSDGTSDSVRVFLVRRC